MILSEGYSLQGVSHDTNQDSFYLGKEESLFAVADGMGGHRAGDTASKIAIETIMEFKNIQSESALADIVQLINSKIYAKSQQSPDYKGMGTTLVLCHIQGKQAVIYHIGDSRAYLIRDGEASCITKDHSLVQEMVDRGEISESESKTHPMKNVITRAVGVQETTVPTEDIIQIQKDDCILLCSDGVSNVLADEQIAQICTDFESKEAVMRLCERAKELGSKDDITAVLIKIPKIEVNNV